MSTGSKRGNMRTNWAPLPSGLNAPARRLVEELRALKDANGLTLAALAGSTHYSRASWERWLNGKRPLTAAALTSLTTALGIDSAPLLDLLRQARAPEPDTAQADTPDADTPDADTPDAARTGPAPTGAAAQPPGPVPAQLPADIGDFAGRQEEVQELVAALADAEDRPGRVPIATVTGGGGLGKTSLAVHVAHQLAHRFPDGQLYTDLRGADQAPRDPAEVAAGWLRALGDAAEEIPGDPDERAAHLRSRLHGRRILVVVDNARNAGQIAPLLPGGGGCALLVTSRDRLSELPGAHRLELGPLPDAEALALLERAVGAERVAAEPVACGALVRLCAGWPLALRIIGGRLHARTNWPLSLLADRLRDEGRRLDELAVGDLAVRTTFQVGYRALRPATGAASPARAFRLLSLAPGADVSLPAAAALFGIPVHEADAALESLVDAHLLESPVPGRYRQHDLLRLYALELVRQHESEQERDSALQRVVSWYVLSAANAGKGLASHLRSVPLEAPLDVPAAAEFANHEDALAWFDAEGANLVAAVSAAAARGLHDLTWKLAASQVAYFNLAKLIGDWIDTHEVSLRAAEAVGNPEGQAWMLHGLGAAHVLWRAPRTAIAYLQRALALRRELDDTLGQALTLNNLAYAFLQLQDDEMALDHFRLALGSFEKLGYRAGQAASLCTIGTILLRSGELEASLEVHRRALAIAEADGYATMASAFHESLGEVHAARNEYADAAHHFERSVAMSRELGDRRREATALAQLAQLLAVRREAQESERLFATALEILESCADPLAEQVRAQGWQAVIASFS